MITRETAKVYLEQIRQLIDETSRTAQEKGDDFERRFTQYCESRGHVVVKPSRCDFDYIIDGLRVQCKSLSVHDGSIPLHSGASGFGRAYRVGSIDVFAIETQGVLYIVPAADMPVSSKNEGDFKSRVRMRIIYPYENAWWVIERGERPAGFVRQLALWGADQEGNYGR